MTDFDVIVLGDYCLDIIFTGLPSLPELGKEIEGTNLSVEPGGSCNVTLALHRLGVRTAWSVEFGSDDFSQFVLKKFREEKFPEDLFQFSQKQLRKITVSLSYPEDRAFIAYYDPGDMITPALKALTAKTARMIVIPGLFTGPALAAGNMIAKAKKMDLFMDGNSSSEVTIFEKTVRKALELVRIFSPNSKEAMRLTKKGSVEEAIKILGEICQTVIVKDGANGCWGIDNNILHHIPAYPVKVIDTTGAGDCFNAGFIKAWLDGRSFEQCLLWGNIAGALSTQMAGANNYRLTSTEIQTIIDKRK